MSLAWGRLSRRKMIGPAADPRHSYLCPFDLRALAQIPSARRTDTPCLLMLWVTETTSVPDLRYLPRSNSQIHTGRLFMQPDPGIV